jgi:hypothetical protein
VVIVGLLEGGGGSELGVDPAGTGDRDRLAGVGAGEVVERLDRSSRTLTLVSSAMTGP